MRRGGAVPKTPPTGWVFVGRHRGEGVTIRWRRGDREAHVLRGNNVGSWGTDGLLSTIPVPPRGWVDLAEVRTLAHRWARDGELRPGDATR